MHKINLPNSIAASFAFLTFLVTFFFIKNLHYNYDLSDESYYVYLSAFPDRIYGSLSSFSYFLNLIFIDLNSNIFAFRMFGVITLLIIISLLFYNLSILFELNKIFLRFIDKIYLYCFLIFGGLFFYSSWLPTPSYNWLVLILILLFLICKVCELNLSNNIFCRYSFLTESLIITILFLAKPTSGVLIFLINFFSSFFLRQNLVINILYNFFNIIIILLLSTLFINFFYGSLEIYFNQFLLAMKIESILTTSREIVPLISSPITSTLKASSILFNDYKPEAASLCTGLILVAFFRKHSLLIIFIVLLINIYSRTFVNLLLILILFNYIINTKIIFTNYTYCILFLILLIFVYSFGSSNNLFIQSIYISILYFLITYLILIKLDNSHNKFQSYLIILISCLHVLLSIKNSFLIPYNFDKRIDEFVKTQVSITSKESLNLSKDQSDFMNFTSEAFKKNNWKKNLYLIDLSGKSPGLLYLLDAKSVGNPWLNGYFAGSDNYAKNILDLYSKEHIKKSWLIISENGQNNISKKVIENRIGNLNKNYFLFAKYNYRNEDYTFWKPKK